jgi:hypothetical protein
MKSQYYTSVKKKNQNNRRLQNSAKRHTNTVELNRCAEKPPAIPVEY